MDTGRIASKYEKDLVICRTCASVLTVLSYDVNSHVDLSTDSLLKTIFQLSRSDDILTRLNVTTTLCNISIDAFARKQLILHGILDIVSTLSGTTSERIQELCARCICNLTLSVDMHSKLIEDRIIQNLLMISLVRSVANQTKQLCAKGLLNMCTEANLSHVLEAGVCRAFSTLSALSDPVTQNITARSELLYVIDILFCLYTSRIISLFESVSALMVSLLLNYYYYCHHHYYYMFNFFLCYW